MIKAIHCVASLLLLTSTTTAFSSSWLPKRQSVSIHNQNYRITTRQVAADVHTSTTASSSSDASVEWDMSLFSPAKINLFLRIIRKREDGFHDLASLFQTIGFGDYLHIKKLGSDAEDDVLTCNMDGVPTDRTNLVMRAVDLVREKTGIQDQFFQMDLVKYVPHQAGLGGGSGNAAAALYGVNELLGNPATLEELVEWSGELGSDITFFLSEGTAYCTGRGEIMTPVPPLPNSAGTKLCIVKPDIGLSTPSVFKALDYDKLSEADPENVLKIFQTEGVSPSEEEKFINDLERPAFKVLPDLDELKNDLISCGFETVMMSGSGTSIFCIGSTSDPEKFSNLIESRDDVNVYSTEFINRDGNEWYTSPDDTSTKIQ